MKTGIITYYDVPNYGAVLLAFSMKKILEQSGHEVVFLKYKRHRETDRTHSVHLRGMRKWHPNALRAAVFEHIKIQRIASFRKKNLSVGDYYDIPQGLDMIVVGSDQIFDCKYEFNPYQFAVNVPCDKIISYAPSFGEFNYEDLQSFPALGRLKEFVCRFTLHSARDENTRKILSFLTGKTIETVLDPVLLYGFEEEKQAWNRRIVRERYLIVYTWGGYTVSSGFRNSVLEFAQRNELKTVSIGDFRPWCDYNYAAASPVTFFELFQHCEMVITNMFHGTCFSILFGKPFYTMLMEHNRNKTGDLLSRFGLTSQGLESSEALEGKGIPTIDYLSVNTILEKNRQDSCRYLKEAINTK